MLRLSLLCLLFFLTLFTKIHAAPPPASTLKNAYLAWRNAVITKNHSAWKQYTAHHRRIKIHNTIVSQKLPFPQALFDFPLPPPDIKPLQLLGIQANQHSATAAYFGAIDFGILSQKKTASAPKNNLLLLRFTREQNTWKFDKIHYLKTPENSHRFLASLKKNPTPLSQLLQQNLPENRPQNPPLCPIPDHVAYIEVQALKAPYEISINKKFTLTATAQKQKHLIIGGLQKGDNTLTFKQKNLPPASTENPLEIKVILPSHPAPYHYKSPTPPKKLQATFFTP